MGRPNFLRSGRTWPQLVVVDDDAVADDDEDDEFGLLKLADDGIVAQAMG